MELPPPLLMFHYLHAIRRANLKSEHENDFHEFLIALVRPDVWADIESKRKLPIATVNMYGDDIDMDTFRKISELHKQRSKQMETMEVITIHEDPFNMQPQREPELNIPTLGSKVQQPQPYQQPMPNQEVNPIQLTQYDDNIMRFE